jgi:hypothetical protein
MTFLCRSRLRNESAASTRVMEAVVGNQIKYCTMTWPHDDLSMCYFPPPPILANQSDLPDILAEQET